MTNRLVLVASAIVVMALAAPPAALAQAQRRGGSSSGSSSSTGSSSGSSGGGSSVATPRQPAAMPRPVDRQPSSPSATTGARSAPPRGESSADQRTRSARPAVGTAQPRPAAPRPGRPGAYDPWYRWSPGYSFGYGIGYGYGYPYSYGIYSPWGYRSGLWGWGSSYDPFMFGPFGYTGAPYWGVGAGARDERDTDVRDGSIRFRVKPDHARVYIDGALAGVASEFGGLTGHLDLPPGLHDVELRAEGYLPFNGQVEVREGRTRTERVNLKREQ